MPLYTCPRCGYNTKIKTHIKKHYNRKKSCIVSKNDITIEECLKNLLNNKANIVEKQYILAGINTSPSIKRNTIITNNTDKDTKNYGCNTCLKKFNRKDNLLRHTKMCKKQIITHNESVFTKSEVENIMKEMEKEHNKKEVVQNTIIEELRKQIGGLMLNSGCNITYNTSIVLNAFGKENTSYIDKGFIDCLIKSGPLSSIPKLLEYIHFNPEHMENQNIQIPNKRATYAKIFNGEIWQMHDKKRAIETMTDKAYYLINKHYGGCNEYMNEFQDNYDKKDRSVSKRVYKDTEFMILNNQNILNK
tara:strand:+ start:153 stop:1064 length:912 start_codon:yes stop_codon:yes gene_type:complete